MTTLQTPLTVATTATSAAALVAGKHTPVDATSAPLTMSLPTPATVGARVRVEKVDASANAVTVSGTIRGSASTVALAWQFESIELVAESLTSWRPSAGHKTKAALDAAYETKGAATAAQAAAVQRANHTGTQAASTVTGLATVATTGAYADLSGKPTLGTAAAQPTSAFDAAGAAAAVLPTQTGNSGKYLTTNGTSPSWATVAGGGGSILTPTATKTATYTAVVGDLAMMNVPGGATTLTLPAAPADKSQVGYRAIGATTAVPLTVNRGGSDTIGTAGATSASVVMADETVILQYDAPNTRWLGVSSVRTQATLDARYDAAGAAAFARMASDTPIPSAGKYIAAQGTVTTSPAVGALRAYPITLGAAGTADRIGIQVTTLAAGSTIALGIYAHDTTTGLPGAKLLDAGTVSGAAAGFMEITISQVLPAATYWLAALPLGGAPTLQGVATTSPTVIPIFSQAEFATTAIAVSRTGQTSLPDPFAPTATINAVPRTYLRFA